MGHMGHTAGQSTQCTQYLHYRIPLLKFANRDATILRHKNTKEVLLCSVIYNSLTFTFVSYYISLSYHLLFQKYKTSLFCLTKT